MTKMKVVKQMGNTVFEGLRELDEKPGENEGNNTFQVLQGQQGLLG